MNWILESAGIKVLAIRPGGVKLHAFAQKRITESASPTRKRLRRVLFKTGQR